MSAVASGRLAVATDPEAGEGEQKRRELHCGAACTAAGMDYFVSKPLTPAALIGALNQVLSDGAEAEAA